MTPNRRRNMSTAKPTVATPDEIAGLVGLQLEIPAQLDLDRVLVAFGQPDADWLGQRLPADASDLRRYSSDLELSVGSDRSMFRKSAVVGVGAPVHHDDTWLVPIEWRAASFARLFPTFDGHLRIHGNRIQLDGQYTPPGGSIGYVLDRALLHIIAQGTARWFVQKVVSVLEADAA
jgi:hypothetical protein